MATFETVHHGKDSPEEIRRKRMANHRQYCVHYNGRGYFTDEGPCLVGLQKRDAPRCRACIGGHELPDPVAVCPKWERRSEESAAARADELEHALDRMTKVGPVIEEWRTKPPIGKDATVECPACGTGQLFLSQSARNGHVAAKCSTEGCVSFIE